MIPTPAKVGLKCLPGAGTAGLAGQRRREEQQDRAASGDEPLPAAQLLGSSPPPRPPAANLSCSAIASSSPEPTMINPWPAHGVPDMCGRADRRKRNRPSRLGAWSGADMCPASNAARHPPQARMGSGIGSSTVPRARGARQEPGFPDPVSSAVAPYLPSDLLTPPTAPGSQPPTRLRPDLGRPHRRPEAPIPFGPSCWRAPP